MAKKNGQLTRFVNLLSYTIFYIHRRARGRKLPRHISHGVAVATNYTENTQYSTEVHSNRITDDQVSGSVLHSHHLHTDHGSAAATARQHSAIIALAAEMHF